MLTLVWMRRDLRLHDHAALATALAEHAPVQPVFVFDTDILARFHHEDDRRLVFLAETLCRIDRTFRVRGGRLLIFHGRAPVVIPKLVCALNADLVVSAEDFEPDTRARDAAIKKALHGTAAFVQVLDHLLRAPQQMLKKDGTPYKVFTPFYKLWRAGFGPSEVGAYSVNDKGRYAAAERVMPALRKAKLTPIDLDGGPEHVLKHIGYRYKKDPLWTVHDAPKRLKQFIDQRLHDYVKGRDPLDRIGTSQLSPYLRHGLVSVRECARAALAHRYGEKWISELAWREFYAAILYHFPEVVKHEFSANYRHGAIPWDRSETLQNTLFSGKTGYPVIDAAARELLSTGYMHNRARMIFASFATKDLMLDWRLGEEFFAQYLMDYELASNNGGWQWAASTGTDAAPYFRVFNPVLQSKKFDPKGEYIKQYVPELRGMNAREIHAPWLAKSGAPENYPAPMVDHAKAKEKAIAAFRRLSTRHLP